MPKPIPTPAKLEESWQIVGKKPHISNQDPIIQHQVQMALGKGGSAALDAVTNLVESSSRILKEDEIDDSTEEIEELIADACPFMKGPPSMKTSEVLIIPSTDSKAGLPTDAAGSSPPSCPQSSGSNTKKNKNKRKGNLGRSTKGH